MARFLKLKEVIHRTALSSSEIYRRIERGTFPKQIKIGAKASVWLEADIQKWIEDMIEGGTAND